MIARAIRAAAAALAFAGFAGGSAGAQESATILVNTAFSPTSVDLGAASTVTITLQNTSTVTAANVTSLVDDIATMGGKAAIASPSGLATTCAGGTPAIAGTVVSMKNGKIPVAPNATTAGTCTVTFAVVATNLGNGINTIPVDGLQTDIGSNATPASQTLQVVSLPLAVAGSPDTNVLTTQTTTQSFTITNPTAATLTGGAFVVNTSSSSPYTLSNGTTTCGGSVTFGAFPATSGQAKVTKLRIPPNASCTVKYTAGVAAGSPNLNVAASVAASAITTDQGLTNPAGASARSYFWSGRPSTSKSFSPSTVTPGGTTRMSVTIGNTLTTPLTNAGFTDDLPAGLRLSASPNPAFNANCGSPAIAGAGTATFRMSGATIPGATTLGQSTGTSSCTVTISLDVAADAPASITNTIPAGNFTNAQGIPGNNDANATLSVSASGLTSGKSFSTSSVARLTPVTVTLTFTNGGTSGLTDGTFVDRLPQSPVPMVAVPAVAPAFSGCGPAGAQSVTFGNGNTVVTGAGLSLTANGGRCQVKFSVQFASGTSTAQTDTNVVLAPDVTFKLGSALVHPAADFSANLSTKPAFITRNYLANAFGLSNDSVTVQGQIIDQAGSDVTDTNAVATFTLNSGSSHNVALAPQPAFAFGPDCPGGLSPANIQIGAAREAFSVSIPALNSTCTIAYDVTNEVAGATGQFGPGQSSYTSSQNGGTNSNGGANSVRFSKTALNMNKVFVPNRISSGSISVVHITLGVQPIISFPNTQANGVRFADTLPATLLFAPKPAVTFGPQCQEPGQPQPRYAISGSTITVSDISLEAAAAAPCSVEFQTTSLTLGNVTNTLPAGAVTSTSGSTNSQAASSTLSVVPGVGLQKSFLSGTIPVGGSDDVRLEITNSSSLDLGAGTLSDTMPAQLVLKSTTPGTIRPGDPVSCGATVGGTIGSNTFTLSGLKVAAAQNAGTPGRCVTYVAVKTSASAAPGTYLNTIPAGGLVIGGLMNETPAAATIIITPPAAVTLEKSFAPATINPNGTSVLSISIANTAEGASPLTGIALTDALPKGVLLATVPNASTTCAGGTVGATPGASNVSLSGASLPAGATCKIVATVTAAVAGAYTNTISAGALTTTEGASNAKPASAVLTVVNAPPVDVSKAFAPSPIVIGGTSRLTVTISNKSPTAVALTAISLTDVLPGNVTVATASHDGTTCAAGTVTAGGASIFLSGGSLAAGATCTFFADVTSGIAGTYVNAIAAGTLASAQGASNASQATATLDVTNAPAVEVTKAFSPAAIPLNGTSVATVTVRNAARDAVPLTNLAFNDALPAGTEIAASPNASTTCAGTVTAAAGSASFALSGGALAAGKACTVSVSVLGTAVGTHLNTIAANAVSSLQGATNDVPATATLDVSAPDVELSKAFAPAAINPHGISTVTIAIANTKSGAIALSKLALTDTLPAGVTVASAARATTTCANGNASATPGGNSVTLADGNVAAGATCTLSVEVTGTLPGAYTNTIPAASLTSREGASNAVPASAVLTIANAPDVTLAKTFAPASILPEGISKLTIGIANTASGAVALSGLALTDTLPAGVTVAASPGASTTCGNGSVGAVAGGTSVSLSGGSVGANASCTIAVDVTSALVGVHANTIPASALASTQGATNAAPASADLTVSAPPVALAKTFAPAQINPHGISQLSVTVANTATGAVALSAMALTDSLPAGVTVAAPAGASTTCGPGTLDAKPGDTSVALAGGTLAAGATCTILVNVTSTQPGRYVNRIPAGALATAQGSSNTDPGRAILTVVSAPDVTLSKSFDAATIAAGGTSRLTLTIANTAAGAGALTGIGVTDTLPASVVIAPRADATTTCLPGGAVAIGGVSRFALAGGSLAAKATCTVSLNVTAAAPGSYLNTVPAGQLTSLQGATNNAPAAATLLVTAAPPVTLAKNFAPTAVVLGGTSVLTLTIDNAAPGAVALTGLGVSDALPAGVQIGPVPNASTTCGAGSVTAAPGATTLALSGGGVRAGAACSVAVTVTGTVPGTHRNTVAANAVSSLQGATNNAPATAALDVSAPAVTLSKIFTPATINPSGISTLTISIANTASGAIALSKLALADTLPAAVTVAPLPAASTTCGTGSVTAAAGSNSVVLSGGSVAAGATCALTVNVTSAALGGHVNTIPAGALTSAQGASNPAAASATLTVVNAPAAAVAKTFAPASIVKGGTSVLRIAISNLGVASVALSGLTLTDALPAGVTVAATPGAATTCGNGSVGAVAGGTSVALTNGSLGANATCTIAVNVTSAVVGSHLNTIPAGALGSSQGASNPNPASATLTVITAPDVSLSKAFAPASIVVGSDSRLTIAVANTAPGAVALSSVALRDALPSGVSVAATPATSTTCGSGSVVAPPGGASVSLSGGSIDAGATCTVSVSVTSSVLGSHANTIPAGNVTSAQDATNGTPASAVLAVYAPHVSVSKVFAPVTIHPHGTSTLTISVANTLPGALALSGVSLTDALPAGVNVAAVPDATTTCGSGTVEAHAGDSNIALAGGSVAGGATCTISVSVTSDNTGTYVNTIPAGALASTQGATNAGPAAATLAVVSAPNVALGKAFAPAAIVAGGISTATVSIVNNASGAAALTGLSLSDTLPAGVTIAAKPGASTTCGAGSIAAAAGGTSFSLTGGSVAGGSTCTISVSVTTANAGTYLNTIPAGEIASTQGATNATAATATLIVRIAPPVAVTKGFAPASIALDGTSLLTIAIANNGAGAVALSALGVGDALPAGIEVAATPGASTTCAGGTVDARSGATAIALTGGSLPAGATCTLAVRVTGVLPGAHLNTISANAVTTAQGATNTAPATATLTVAAPAVSISKAFAPAGIAPAAVSRLAVAVANTASGAVALGALSLSDALPAGVTIAATPNAATTCSGGVSAPAGGTSVSLSGGSLGAGATCTVSVNVTSAALGAHVNTIPAGNVSTAQGASNAAPASAVLTVVNAPGVDLSKTFAPAAIATGGNSRLTIAIANSASGAQALSSVALRDALPSGVSVAATPAASTTCGSGSVDAAAGGTSVSLSGGSIDAGATCTVTVSVASSVLGSHTNTIPAGNVTSAQGAGNAAPASAVLTVYAPHASVSKVFAPVTIHPHGTSTLTISVANTLPGAIALGGMSLTDALPAGVNVAATPGASTTCGSGTVAAKPGDSNIALAGGSLASGATCTISVSVTSDNTGAYVNTIPAGALASTQGATNATPANAALNVANAPDVTLAKAFAPATILRHRISQLTLTIADKAPGAVALTGLGIGDALPAGVTVAPVPGAATTCGAGSVGAVAGATRVSLTGGALAAGASCTVTVNVTGANAGTYLNSVPAGDVTSAQGATNANAANATLTVQDAVPVALTKSFLPGSIAASGEALLTITIANTAPGAAVLTGASLTDALPSGVEIAAVPNAATSCPRGAAAASPGGASVALSGGLIGPAATCTITVTVTAPKAGTFVNRIPAGELVTHEGATNASPAVATLTAFASSVALTKAFAPESIAIGGTSQLTIAIANNGSGAVALSALGVTDTLPGGLAVAAAPNAATTCSGGTVDARPGANAIALRGARLAAGARCTLTVGVTAGSPGTHVNTIPVNAVSNAQGVTNNAPATATLTVPAQAVTVSKAFAPAAIAPSGNSRLTITIANGGEGAVALTALALTDALPANVTLAAVPAASTTCGSGGVQAVAGGSSVSLRGGSLAAKSTCTVGANVTASVPGTYTNTIPAGALTSREGASNAQAAVANLQVGGARIFVTKSASAQVVTTGGRVDYAIGIAPPAGAGLEQTTIVDQLPQFETYAPGTARVNGQAREPAAAGRTLTWTLPALQGQITIVYSTAIALGVPQNTTLTNTVGVTARPAGGGQPLTGAATATVLVAGSTFGSCYPITGRVYQDLMGSGRFETGDAGVAGAQIYLDDGESVTTDDAGRYNFPCVRPGMHALRLDETSLPADVRAYDDRSIDSERSTRRLVHRTFDDTIVEDINFAVKGPG